MVIFHGAFNRGVHCTPPMNFMGVQCTPHDFMERACTRHASMNFMGCIEHPIKLCTPHEKITMWVGGGFYEYEWVPLAIFTFMLVRVDADWFLWLPVGACWFILAPVDACNCGLKFPDCSG